MKEIYDWVPWFTKLGKKIAEGGEKYLADRATRVKWRNDGSKPGLLLYGNQNVDPFSFIYTLASRSKHLDSRNRIYPSIAKAFHVEEFEKLDDDEKFYFPKPMEVNTLFHKEGSGNPSLLWKLFGDAIKGIDAVNPEDFEEALKIPQVAKKKLTQALFLINPKEFLPIDERTESLGIFDSSSDTISWNTYANIVSQIREEFPECDLYEVNLFAFLNFSRKLIVRDRYFAVSTNVSGSNPSIDEWEDFRNRNSVRAGWSGPEGNEYGLDVPEKGDIILVKIGRHVGHGIGVVYRNEYNSEYNENDQIHVIWLNKSEATLSRNMKIDGFMLCEKNFETFIAFQEAEEYAMTFQILERIRRMSMIVKEGSSKSYPLNKILYGPPGTGKTRRATVLALAIVDNMKVSQKLSQDRLKELRFNPNERLGQIAMITFHQNYSYEDFVEGIRPVLMNSGGQMNQVDMLDVDGKSKGDMHKNSNITYEMREGIFKILVKVAKDNESKRFVLVIDEINRGNIPKIFGELITLIEDSRRDGNSDPIETTLPYSGDPFSVPNNLYIIGTMNTADRSIQLLDTALRRRFDFEEMMPDPDHEKINENIDGINCRIMLRRMNERITSLLDREHQIGHTNLLNVNTIDELSHVFRNRIFPLLQEYFFNDWEKIQVVLGYNEFVQKNEIGNLLPNAIAIDEVMTIFERLPDSSAKWTEAEQYLRIYIGKRADETESL